MKKQLILSILSAWMVLLAGNAQQRVIVDPDVESSTSESVVIEKIICSDTATIFYVDAYNHPGYWVKFASSTVLIGSQKKVYKLVAAENFELDKEVFMPESGYCSFILRFEPLDKHETCLDFLENDVEGGYAIKGISLEKKKKNHKKFCCKLEGTIVDRPYSSRLKLRKITENIRLAETYIPIRNNKFSYELNFDDEEAYELIFMDEWNNASWRPVRFYPADGTVFFTLYPQKRYKEYKVTGGDRNAEYQTYLQKEGIIMSEIDSVFVGRNRLFDKGDYYTELALSLRKEISAASEANDRGKIDSLWRLSDHLHQTGEAFTPNGKRNNEDEEAAFERWNDWKLKYAEEHPTIVGYSVFMDLLNDKLYKEKYKKEVFDSAPFESIYRDIYKSLFPEHPYTGHVKELLLYRTVLETGDEYIDFTLPDLQGKMYTLSDQVRGKVALIDFWSTWCGPCIGATVGMIPVYEKYKDKGFTVVAIVQEDRNMDMLRQTVDKHNFPWITLIDRKSRDRTWKKYGISDSGGGLFLIDAEGKILFINPKPETVDKILADLF